MQTIAALLNLLSTGPGAFVYHLLILLSLEAVAGIALIEYRHTRNPDQQRILWAFLLLLILRIPLLIASPLGDTVLAPLLYALEVVSLTLMWWAFLSPLVGRRIGRLGLLGSLALIAVVTAAFMPGWLRMHETVPFFEYAAFGQQTVWDAWATLIAIITAAMLLFYSQRLGYSLPAIAFAFLAVGNGLILFEQVGLGRIINLLGYPLLAVTVYRSALQDLWSYRQELETLSDGALRQTQELLSMVEISQTIGQSLDLDIVLRHVVESIAGALNADRAAIFLVDEETNNFQLVAQYAVLQSRAPQEGPPISPVEQPLLAHAIQRQRQIVIDVESRAAQLHSLCATLGSQESGPAIIQPLIRRRRPLGALVVVNDQRHQPFGEEKARLCNSIATQVSAAIDNARLYHRLDQQARHLAEMLKTQEEEAGRREAILESIAEGVIVTNAEGRAILVNATTESILGIPRPQILGQPLQQALEALTSEQRTTLHQLATTAAPLQTLFEIEGRNIHVNAAPVRLPSGERVGLVAVMRDVTREVQAERAKRDFIATISHELRTPLTAILGYAELLYNGMVGKLNDTQSHFIRIVHDNARRMIAMANNLIALSEADRGQLELEYADTDLHLAIREVIQAFAPQIRERQMSLTLEVQDNLPMIEADPARIRQVLANLVSNAIKFTFPGGRLTVGAAALRDNEEDEPAFCQLWVTDTGVGIPPEEMNRIWERFYRADNPLKVEAGGLGVGLSIVKSLVEAHGGRVWVESAVGKGSAFSILLPTRRRSPIGLTAAEEYPDVDVAARMSPS